MRIEDFSHEDVWKTNGKNFSVHVVRCTSKRQSMFDEELGENEWNIYVNIYKKHPAFPLVGESIYDVPEEITALFHGGCTFISWCYDSKSEPYKKKIGCDYCHLGDDKFSLMMHREDAKDVFEDAINLFNKLEEMEVQNEKAKNILL